MNGKTLNKQLWTMMLLLIAGLLIVAICESVISRLSLYGSRRLALTHEGETATSVVMHWKELAQAGSISTDMAKQNAIAELRSMRYGANNSGYFNIYDSKAVRVLNLDQKTEGTSAADLVDPNGKHIALEVIRSDGPGGDHFTTYQWPHPGQKKPVDKLVYSDYVHDWDWHIYTGDYVDDIDAAFVDELLKGLIAVAVVGGLLGIAMQMVIKKVRRSIGGEPMVAAEVARAVAAGNLDIEVPLMFGDKTSLMASLAEMRVRLGEIVSEIRTSANAITLAAGEVAQGSGYLSQRTEQQAAALQETAASMDQLAVAVQQNSEATENAHRLTSEVALTAKTGGESVENAVDTMSEISESSAQITSIIAVIESIAFQTNILALNAAVEAARAGDEGRGFAVVAGEVRTLAQRSAAAAKEIKALISRSVERTNAGEETVRQTGKAINDVVSAVDRVSAIMAGITASTTQQSFGIKQINQAVKQMDEVTQQNAALVEQGASSAQALADHAKELNRAVSAFRTG